MSLLAKSLLAPARRSTEAVDVPRAFLGFCEWLGVELTPGQSELARVCFDGVEPVDRDLAAAIFGANVPLGRRRVVAAVCGRRAGKSYVLVALRMVHGMLVRDVPKLPAGIRAVAMITAPRDSMRREALRYAIGAVESKAELRAMLVGKPTADEFTLRRPDGKLVSFETGVATAGATGARGRWFTDFVLDESAFFRDASFKVNDEELFNGGIAALLPGGQMIVTSTPWAEAGLLYRLWKDRPGDTAVAHAPTLVLNDSDVTREIVAQAEATDPDNAAREFGAKFMTTGTTVFFESSTIDASLTEDPFELQPGDIVAAGADFGFRSDSSALLMVALRGDMLHIFDGTEERPEEGAPLRPGVTVKAFVDCIDKRCDYLMADGHYREAITEHLETHGLNFAAAPLTPADTHVRARMVLREARLRIHPLPFRDRLVQQMREVHGKPTSGGGMSITYPRWAKGGHGDLVAALVLAMWQVTGTEVPAAEAPPGTQEWVNAQREQRQRRLRERLERPQWMAKGDPVDRGRRANWRNG